MYASGTQAKNEGGPSQRVRNGLPLRRTKDWGEALFFAVAGARRIHFLTHKFNSE